MSEMAEFRTRIGKVTRKGGATVSVIEGKFIPSGQAREFCAALNRAAGNMVEWYRDDMAGYVILAWDTRGRLSMGWRNGDLSPVPRDLLPEFTASVIRRLDTTTAAVDEMREQLTGWR